SGGPNAREAPPLIYVNGLHCGRVCREPRKPRENDHETCNPGLASAFALSSTFAFAYTTHHKKTHAAAHSSQCRNSYGQYYGSQNNRAGGWNTRTGVNSQYYGNPNNRGGLVGGSDQGTYRY